MVYILLEAFLGGLAFFQDFYCVCCSDHFLCGTKENANGSPHYRVLYRPEFSRYSVRVVEGNREGLSTVDTQDRAGVEREGSFDRRI